MNCWEILGIEPTRDRQRVQDAYENQLRFASDSEAVQLKEAFREAIGEPVEETPVAPAVSSETRELDASESQVAREVVIQIKALLNDSGRTSDAGIWKAILCEPPADQLPVRREIGRQLEPQLRPMAENGSFPGPVVRFLAEWFDWHSLQDAVALEDERSYPEPDMAEEGIESEPPQMVNFWPAVIGWVIGLVILAMLFGGMGGG
ncbi:J domain-containing protein [Marinobacter sp. 2_MG-2023]|uniref:J domain-containing protein n=1 Tax=Marinobacter sp. 2_MG-2023 TaxID=3062679 RepID=UPI0026E3B345|nr:J domain-containing protein [Marinobacter sp. 2_MG-2023]MDO6442265.1 J domain-containing protein [Marinobacter sp. 2_MG-2023]